MKCTMSQLGSDTKVKAPSKALWSLYWLIFRAILSIWCSSFWSYIHISSLTLAIGQTKFFRFGEDRLSKFMDMWIDQFKRNLRLVDKYNLGVGLYGRWSSEGVEGILCRLLK